MDTKRKVKSISEAEIEDKVDEVIENKKDEGKKLKSLDMLDPEDVDYMDDGLGKRFKYIALFLCGVIVTIALCSLVSKSDDSFSGGKLHGNGIDSVYKASVYVENYSGNRLVSSGKGLVYKKDDNKGYILTNYHVVSESGTLKVMFFNNSTVTANFVGGDEHLDIAVISVPVSSAKGINASMKDIDAVLNSIGNNKDSKKPFLGISMVNLNDSYSLNYYGLAKKINTNLKKGVVVEDVKENTSSYGKLHSADIITKLDNVRVDDMAHLRYELSKKSIGDKVTVTVERNGVSKNIEIVLKSK